MQDLGPLLYCVQEQLQISSEEQQFDGESQNEEQTLRDVDQKMRLIFESFPDSIEDHCLAVINSVSLHKYNTILSKVQKLDSNEVQQNLKRLTNLAHKLDLQTIQAIIKAPDFRVTNDYIEKHRKSKKKG